MMYGNDWDWWAWLPMMVAMIAVLGAIAWAVLRLAATQGDGGSRDHDSRQILDARLARGEIDVAEYEDLRRALEGRGG
jgi:putative membrane protein